MHPRNPKPLVLLLVDSLSVGGTERQIVELLKGLRIKSDFRVALGVINQGGALEDAARSLVDCSFEMHRRSRYDLNWISDLIYETRRSRVLLIHAVGWMSAASGLLAAKLLRIPIINGCIRDAPPVLDFQRRVSRVVARLSDSIVANSHAGLVAYGHEHRRRAQVIRNGIDLERYHRVVHVETDEHRVCMVANFSRYKDHATVLRAFRLVTERLPNAKLVLIGRDAGTLDQTRVLTRELSLGHHVQFENDCDDPGPFIRQSAVCVLASTQGEGLSNAIMEYMALGKPVIATRDGGNRELIRHGHSGYLVPALSPNEMAERLGRLLCNPGMAKTMGESGEDIVARNFQSDRMVQAYSKLYRQLAL